MIPKCMLRTAFLQGFRFARTAKHLHATPESDASSHTLNSLHATRESYHDHIPQGGAGGRAETLTIPSLGGGRACGGWTLTFTWGAGGWQRLGHI